METETHNGLGFGAPPCSPFFSLSKSATGPERKARRDMTERVMRAVWNHCDESKEWGKARWVELIKEIGLLSPKTNSIDCDQITELFVELWNKK